MNYFDHDKYQEQEICDVMHRISGIKSEEYKSSQKEKQWIKYIEETQRKQIISQYKIGKYIVDGFDGENIYQFNGCFWHGCNQCFPTGTNCVNNQSFSYLYKRTLNIEEQLKKKHNVISIWEHDFDKLAKVENMPSIDDADLPLNTRHAMFGGRTETFTSYAKNVKLYYGDFVSLYPTVNKYDRYPSGKCKTIKNPDKWDNNWIGFAKITVKPNKLYAPVLPSKRAPGKGPCKLTFDCFEKTGTWATVEINYALSQGYEIEKIHEVRTYDMYIDGLFKEYVDMFMKIKIEATGLPGGVAKKSHCKYVYDKCGVKIDPDKICKNEGLRYVAKLCLNSLWGKFGQNLDVDDVVYIDNELDYFKYFDKARRYEILNNKIVYMKIGGKKKPSFRTSMCVAAFTTAHARIRLHKKITEILNIGGKIYYCDTDSVIFWLPDGVQFDFGEALGEFKNELKVGEFISDFVSIGAKAYAYYTTLGNETIKLKGIPEKNRKELFDTMMKIVKGEKVSENVPTGFTFKVDSMHQMFTQYTKKDISNTLDKRQFFSDGTSLPFGH